mmetsp:Transcript_25200/g.59968  ORF Transcript_25200/g.59968 Transcript_25200/m.59968 type:complete len:81 (+) Transcript_25200:108-350(+)
MRDTSREARGRKTGRPDGVGPSEVAAAKARYLETRCDDGPVGPWDFEPFDWRRPTSANTSLARGVTAPGPARNIQAHISS